MLYDNDMVYAWCSPNGVAEPLPLQYAQHQTALQQFCDKHHEDGRAEILCLIFEGPAVFFSIYRFVASESK